MIGVREILPKRVKVNSYIIFLYLQKQMQLVIVYHLGQTLNTLKQFRMDERIFFFKDNLQRVHGQKYLKKRKSSEKKKIDR